MKTVIKQWHSRTVISWCTIFWFALFTVAMKQSLAQDGINDATFTPGTGADNGLIRTIAAQADGKILIGGTFTSYNGTAVGRIARLNTDGTLDATFNSGTGFPADSVVSIAIQTDGKILVGGRFTTYNGVNIPDHLVRLNTNGTYDNTFAPPVLSGSAAGSATHVRAIAIQPDGNIMVGGDWTCAGGGGCASPHRRVMRLLPGGGKDPAYNNAEALAGILAGSWVNSIALQADGKIIIVGTFGTYNGVTVNRILRVNTDGGRDATFASGSGTGTNNSINKVAVLADGDILIAGLFITTSGSINRNLIARLNADGTVDGAFDAGTDNAIVTALCPQPDGKIIIGGNFTTIAGTTINRFARLNSNGTLDASFNTGTGANGVVRAVSIQPNGKLLIGGEFTNYNGSSRSRIARINNTATPVTLRNSIIFDGVNDFITVNHHTDFNVSEFAFEAWVRAPATINPGTYTLFSKEGATVDFRISLISTVAGSFSSLTLTSDVFGNSSSVPLTGGFPNEWHHIYVHATSTETSYYIDGFNFGTSANVPSGTANNTYPIRIGSANGTNFWRGELDEVRFWDGAFDDSFLQPWQHLELTTIGTGSSHFDWPSLKGYWQFNQNENTIINDYSVWPNLNMVDRSCFTYKNGMPSAGMAPGYIQTSTAPIGSIGTSARLTINAAGNYVFTNTDCQVNFPGPTIPFGQFVVTHIDHTAAGLLPTNAQIPGLLYRTSDEYWIVENYSFVPYGFNASMALSGITGLNNADTQLYLATRPSNNYDIWTIGSNAATGINSSTGEATFGGIDSFGQFVPVSLGLSPLPIELIDFDVVSQRSKVLLKWKTALELNNDHFVIERSSMGNEFIPIGKVKGSGTTKEFHSYSFTDSRPSRGINYYRLAQYDFDGKRKYSDIRYMNIDAEDEPLTISIYPNPANNKIQIKPSHFLRAASVVFFDLLSGITVEKHFDFFGWEQEVDISSLKAGLYKVLVSAEEEKAADKVVVVK